MARIILMTGDGEAVAIDESKKLGKGGEGSVYAVQSPARFSHYCVKEYLPAILNDADKMAERQAKIEYMVAHPVISPDPSIVICWPVATIYRDGRFVGFMMLRAFDQSRELEWFVSYNLRKVILQTPFKSFDGSNGFIALYNRTVVANNLALALHLIHSTAHYVLADTKPKNILITSSGNVSIVDLDSVQIVIDGVLRFKAPVASPNYKPPEGYDGRLSQESDIIPVSWDRFSYAVMAYELIIGSHPYGVGTYQAPYDQGDDTMYKIRTGLFLHGNKSPYLVARHDESLAAIKARWNGLPESLRLLFMRAFEKAQFKPEMRPSMVEWGQALSASIMAFQPDEASKIAAANAEREFVAMPQPALARPDTRRSHAKPAAPVTPVAIPRVVKLYQRPLTKVESLSLAVLGLICVLLLVRSLLKPDQAVNEPAPAPHIAAMATSVSPQSSTAGLTPSPLEGVQDAVGVIAEEVVYAPVLKPGMYWQMQRVDHSSSDRSLSPDVSYQIEAIRDNEVEVEKQVFHQMSNAAQSRVSSVTLQHYDKSWNLMNASTGSYAPALQYYDFPLKVGKTWSRSSSVSNNLALDVLSASGEVQHWQDVQTPAGRFHALKIEVMLTAYKETVRVMQIRYTAWYAPEVQHAVRVEEADWDSANQTWHLRTGEQLTAYSAGRI